MNNIPEQPLTPPELPEWSDSDKAEAKVKLAEHIMDGDVWDENMHYRSDMLVDIEMVLVNFYHGTVERDEAMALIRDAWDNAITMYADDQVEHDPERYCEADGGFGYFED